MSNSKNPSYLITPSILDSFRWLNVCPPSWRDRAYGSIVSTIRREPWKPSNSAKRGMKFEQTVYAKAYSINESGSELFRSVVEIVKGGAYQKVLKKNIEVQGLDVVLYGKADVLFNDKIIDIKTTEKFNKDNYLEGWQHRIYTFVSDIKDFEYLIVLFEPYPSLTIMDVMKVPYESTGNELEEIKQETVKLFEWLKDERLFHDYEQIYSNNRRR